MAGFRTNRIAWGVSAGLCAVTGLFALGLFAMGLGAAHHDVHCPDHGSRAASNV